MNIDLIAISHRINIFHKPRMHLESTDTYILVLPDNIHIKIVS